MSKNIPPAQYTYERTHWFDVSHNDERYVTQYIANSLAIAGENGCNNVDIFEVGDCKNVGVCFATNNLIQYTRMSIAMFGDSPDPHGFGYQLSLYLNKSYQDRWILSAQLFLDKHFIDHTYRRLDDKRHQFTFSRQKHMLTFMLAEEAGIICAIAQEMAVHNQPQVPDFNELFYKFKLPPQPAPE